VHALITGIGRKRGIAAAIARTPAEGYVTQRIWILADERKLKKIRTIPSTRH
jgi:hypothetical protein